MVFGHPRGNTLYRILEDYIRRKTRRLGYAEVRTPQLLPRELWIQSGHWEKFGAHMFNFAHGERPIALKPMWCPCHVQIFNRGLRFWRDLPLRYAEWQGADRHPLGHGHWQRNSPARCRIRGARAGRHFGCDGHRNRGALLQATRTIPIVFALVIDPVGAGFVANLAQPGGNAIVSGFWP